MDIRDIEQIIANSDPVTFILLSDVYFKHSRDIKHNIIALLNTKGGIIIFGTGGKKKITGLTYSKAKTIKQNFNDINQTEWNLPVNVTIEEISIPDNKCVIIIKVPEGSDKPYFTSDCIILIKVEHELQCVASKELLMDLFFNDYKEYKEAMANNDFNSLPRNVRDLIMVMKQAISRKKLMTLCDKKDTGNFINNYLRPALEAGVIAKTITDKTTSPNQEYYLTKKGIAFRIKLLENKNNEA